MMMKLLYGNFQRIFLEWETKGSSKLRVDAGGEDWKHWKNLLENCFTQER